jgi:spore coat polysaccharide biosynthesis protein SpsF (cytidylyltransferase family)
MELNTILITQARLGSKRLPKKVMLEISNKSLLEIHLERLKQAKEIDKIIVASTTNKSDELIYNKSIKLGFDCYRGSEENVLDRFYKAVKDHNPKWIVRVTSDCPLIDPILVDSVIKFVKKSDKDYGSNVLIEHFPDGQDIEVFKFSALQKAWKKATLKSELEHVTPFIKKNSDFNGKDVFSSINFPSKKNYSKIRMTVDEKEDLELIKVLVENLGFKCTWEQYTDYIINNNLNKINNKFIRNDGYMKSLKNE